MAQFVRATCGGIKSYVTPSEFVSQLLECYDKKEIANIIRDLEAGLTVIEGGGAAPIFEYKLVHLTEITS